MCDRRSLSRRASRRRIRSRHRSHTSRCSTSWWTPQATRDLAHMRRPAMRRPPATSQAAIPLVQPQFGDVPRILLQLAALDLLDDVGQDRVGAAGHAELLALAYDMAVDELDLGAPALRHVLAHRGTLLGRRLLAVGKALRVISFDRRLVALAGARDRLGRQMQDVLELIAVRLPNPDRLAADTRREAADRLALEHLAAGQAGAGREPVLHGIGDELGPALAPQIVGDQRAVGKTDQAADFPGARGDAAMHLAGAEHGVRRAALAGAAMVSSFMQFCSETTKPSGARYCLIIMVAHAVSYDFMQTKAMSTGFSLASCCTSVM